MYGFCRLGLRPAPSAGASCVANGLATNTSSSAKNVPTAPSVGTTHASTSRPAPRRQDRGDGVAAQDEQPQQQRALLPAPERRQRVAERQLAARVLRDV